MLDRKKYLEHINSTKKQAREKTFELFQSFESTIEARYMKVDIVLKEAIIVIAAMVSFSFLGVIPILKDSMTNIAPIIRLIMVISGMIGFISALRLEQIKWTLIGMDKVIGLRDALRLQKSLKVDLDDNPYYTFICIKLVNTFNYCQYMMKIVVIISFALLILSITPTIVDVSLKPRIDPSKETPTNIPALPNIPENNLIIRILGQ
jgi:hypothetical protein